MQDDMQNVGFASTNLSVFFFTNAFLSQAEIRRRNSSTSKRHSATRWSINGISGTDLMNMLPPDDNDDDEAVLLAVSTQVIGVVQPCPSKISQLFRYLDFYASALYHLVPVGTN
jgi:hypothetical protein